MPLLQKVCIFQSHLALAGAIVKEKIEKGVLN